MGKKLLRSTAVVSGLTMISRVLGFIRDIVFANMFGASAFTDAFFVAFKIPNFFRRLFAEGAFSQAFVPILSEYKSKRAHAEVKLLVASTTGTLGAILLLITVLAVLGSKYLASVFAMGWAFNDEAKLLLAADMLQITFPYLFFISLTALAGGVLNSYGKFAIPALTPVWLNITLIGAAVWLSPYADPPIFALVWGVFVAGAIQLLFQFPALKRLNLLVRPRWGWRDEGVRRIMKLMLPAIFGSSVAQINLLLDTVIASFLVTGSVSWLYYSDRLVEFPLGVFGIALATVILPSLSQKHVEQDPDAFSRTLDWGVRWVFLIGLPAAIGLALLAGPVLTTLFQHGDFQANDVRMSALSLMAYSFGLLGFMLVKVLAPGFFSRQDTKTPVKFGIYAMVANMVMNIVFVVPMVLNDITGPHAGLALATSLSAFINAGLLFAYLKKHGYYKPQPGWGVFALQMLIANIVLVVFILYLSPGLSEWLVWGLAERLTTLMWLILGAIVLYLAMLYIVGLRFQVLLTGSK
jgi:putative peptidoglycan lipid II flippase